MIWQALNEAAERGGLWLVEGGLCRWHLRKDGTITIREILVLPQNRGKGIGRTLVNRLQNLKCPITARCPADYPSNSFWAKMGFSMTPNGRINVWRWSPS